jgi:hypothetical protein
MMRVTTAFSLACCALPCACACAAQSLASTTQRVLSISAGVTHSDRVDQVVSPSRFAGVGLDAGVGFTSLGSKAILRMSVRGGTRTLTSSAQGSTERVTDADLHLTAFAARGVRLLGARIALGVDAQATTAVIAHRYLDPEVRTMSYVFSTMTLGPAVLVERTVGDGAVTVQLSFPVAGVVAQPYSAVWSERSPLDVSFATVTSLRSASAAVAYRSPTHQGVALLYEYRLGAMRYEHDLPVRGLSHSAAIGLARQL